MNTQAILDFLGVEQSAPSVAFLDALVAGYVRRVPWESASRIVRRAQTPITADCPRWPDEFWQGAMTHGFGGTCYESNYAFFALLQSLGFESYLTVNNMEASIGCHTAIVVTLDNARWLVDVGIPLHVPVPLIAGQATQREGPFHTYHITPDAVNTYTISRELHPKPYIFTLIDAPVNEADYRRVTTADYGADGLFLERVIVTRIVDGAIWRFSGEQPPYHLETFPAGNVTYHLLGMGSVEAAAGISAKFAIDAATVQAALEQVRHQADSKSTQ